MTSRIWFTSADISQFPSPFGVHVLKYAEMTQYQVADAVVSVPFRGSCSEMLVLLFMFMADRVSFPSPFGVRVLKFSCANLSSFLSSSFRPLSGFVF